MKQTFHQGELEVQARAGVAAMAERVGHSIRPAIPPAARVFMAQQPFAVAGSVSTDGSVWASLLTGASGFATVLDERRVRLSARPATGDPLAANLNAGAPLGLLFIEFVSRRRMRLNGVVEASGDDAFTVAAEQVFSNCPKYIQARVWEAERDKANENNAPAPEHEGTSRHSLSTAQQQLIAAADTFFIASHHPEGGADASHRGGQPGFVRVLDERTLIWPDYAGNMMFQTLGNLSVNPRAGLLFPNFAHGTNLQLTGRARIVWDAGRAAQFAGAERVVEFTLEEVLATAPRYALNWRFLGYSPFNPASAKE
ncbi:MAG: pyridoxamine 5'-phosphate oxidase family protein [Pyrinomonadaceae bacterium]